MISAITGIHAREFFFERLDALEIVHICHFISVSSGSGRGRGGRLQEHHVIVQAQKNLGTAKNRVSKVWFDPRTPFLLTCERGGMHRWPTSEHEYCTVSPAVRMTVRASSLKTVQQKQVTEKGEVVFEWHFIRLGGFSCEHSVHHFLYRLCC